MEGFYLGLIGEKRIKHYSNTQKILLVGEGDFSFSACLARAFGTAANMVATSLDSRDILRLKYSSVMPNLNLLGMFGCTIIHEVDARTMSHHPLLQGKQFDRIIFNFPHAGFVNKENHLDQIMLHQTVVSGFLRNAREMLTENGEIHVTHKAAYPYNKWNIEKLGQEVGLFMIEKAPFFLCEYPGYNNKRGHGVGCDESFPAGVSNTFKFVKVVTNAAVQAVNSNLYGYFGSPYL
ncbi:DUF2431 domain protein [Quillaja saponaria]|uniref:DUF2431 domain protein n=1 Tax=Quillaja saponaria TaxID=32244 RepID=A0AAD7QJV3_QUISA|nr:DUF2431 domain protein [Quillaja saponaria]